MEIRIETIENIKRWIEESKDLDIRMFILDQTYSKKPEKMFKVRKVGISKEVEDVFVDILLSRLSGIKHDVEEGNRNIRDFFDFNALYSDIFVIPPDEVYVFPHILNQINQYVSLETLKDISDIKRIKSYAIEVKTDLGNRIIYFRKFSESKILSKSKKSIPIALYDGVFNSVKGEVFTIDGGIDCIYFDDVENGFDSIVVTNKKAFEDLFNFKEYYFKNASETLSSPKFLKFVELSEELAKLVTQKVSYAKKITNLIKRSELDDNLKEIFKKSKKRLPALKYEISDEKIKIKDEDGLRDFIEIWEDNIAQSIAWERIYRVRSKEEFRS